MCGQGVRALKHSSECLIGEPGPVQRKRIAVFMTLRRGPVSDGRMSVRYTGLWGASTKEKKGTGRELTRIKYLDARSFASISG